VQQIYGRVAGLDVHRDNVAACYHTLGPRGGAVFEKERFGTTTARLRELEARGGVCPRAVARRGG